MLPTALNNTKGHAAKLEATYQPTACAQVEMTWQKHPRLVRVYWVTLHLVLVP
jgi:hypothetical protein